MKSAQLSTLLSIPLLLTGCGGGDGGGGNSTPPAPAKYTINFLKLKNVSSGTEGTCAIYGQNSESNPTEYTLAYKASGQDMTVYIHDNDGQLLESFTSTDWANGSFSFAQSEVPTDGYVSIVYKPTSGIGDDYDVLTMQKAFIPTTFSLNAKGESVLGSERCLSASGSVEPQNYVGVIDDDRNGAGQFAFSSSVDFQVTSSASAIPFRSNPQETVLGARYDYSASPTGYEPLLAYAFSTANSSTLATPLNLTAVDDPALNWTLAPSATTVLTESNLAVYKAGTGALHWQALPNAVSGTYSYAAVLADDYRLNLKGTHNSWNMNYTAKVPGIATEIDEISVIDGLNIPAPKTTNQLVGSNIESYQTTMPERFTSQRTLVAATSGSNSVHQTIYAKAEQNQPLMVFDNSIDGIWGTTLDKFEISVLSNSDSSEVSNAFLSNYFDAHQVVAAGAGSSNSTDGIAILKTLHERALQKNELKHLENIELSYVN